MIHVDVRRSELERAEGLHSYRVEVSNDGSPFGTLAVCPPTVGDTETIVKGRAEEVAKWVIVGMRYCGADVRATSGGYAL